MSLQNITEPNNLVLYCGQFNCNTITANNTNFPSTADSTSTSTGAIVIKGGLGVGLDQYVGGNLQVDGNITCTDIIYEQIINVGSTSDASSTSTGAIICAGGCGIAKSMYTSNLIVVNTTDSTDRLTGSTVLSGGLGVNKSINCGSTLNVTSTITEFNTSDSSSTSTGSLLVLGGFGLAKSASIGSNLNVNGILNQLNTTDSVSSTTGSTILTGGMGIGKSLFVAGVERVTNTQGSTSSSTGALVVTGGLGVQSASQMVAPLTLSSTNLTPATLTNYMYQSYGNVASSLQNNIQNLNSAGSSDYIMTSDIGDNVSSYVDIGQNGSTNNTGLGGICDGYLYAQASSVGTGSKGGNLYIASPNANTSIYLATGTSNTNIMSIGTNVNILPTSESTDKLTGSIVVSGGMGINGSINCGNNLNVTNTIRAFNTSDSTSTSTGSLLVLGGVGIAQSASIGNNLNVNGISNHSNTTNSTSISTGSLVIAGGVGVSGNEFINGIVTITNTSGSTDTLTGALQVNGGVGITKSVVIGNNLSVTNGLKCLSTTDSTSNNVGSLICLGGTGIVKSLFVGGVANFNNATQTTSTSTGSMLVSGGLALASPMFGTQINLTQNSSLTPASITNYMYRSYGSTNSSLQNNIQNLSSAAFASSDFVATGDLAVDGTTNMIDIGINSSGNSGTIGGICDGHIYCIASSVATGSKGGNLYISNSSANTSTYLLTGGINKMSINQNVNVLSTNNATSVSTGSLQVLGGAGINNDLYVGGNLYSLNYASVIVNPFIFTNSAYDTQTVNTIVTFVQENNVVMCNIQEFGLVFHSAGYLISSSQVPSTLNPNSSSTLTTCYSDTNGTYNILGSAQIDNSTKFITICNGMFQSGGAQPTWSDTTNTTTIHQFTFVYHI